MAPEIETFYPESISAWRKWLKSNHDKKQSVWLICYHKDAGVPTISWSDAVDEALCFGWIDSTRRPYKEKSFIQFFTRRKPDSSWSKINKEKIDRLIKEGRMTKAGLKSIDIAKENGAWTAMDAVEDLVIPDDLNQAFQKHTGAAAYFDQLGRSFKKRMLHWVVTAKRPETRDKRVEEIATCAGKGTRPKQFLV